MHSVASYNRHSLETVGKILVYLEVIIHSKLYVSTGMRENHVYELRYEAAQDIYVKGLLFCFCHISATHNLPVRGVPSKVYLKCVSRSNMKN